MSLISPQSVLQNVYTRSNENTSLVPPFKRKIPLLWANIGKGNACMMTLTQARIFCTSCLSICLHLPFNTLVCVCVCSDPG